MAADAQHADSGAAPYRTQVGLTASLVMRLCGDEAAHTDAGRAFVSMLNLDAGRDMADHVAAQWPHARMHFVLRKWQVWHWLKSLTFDAPTLARQVVVLGAGWSTTGVDWIHHSANANVWEVDLGGMHEKADLIRQRFPMASTRWHPITADLAHLGSVFSGLRATGWRGDQPTLWIAEGIAYYLEPDRFTALIRAALTFQTANRAIVEFGLPPAAMRSEVRERTAVYHGYLASRIGIPELHSVDPSLFCQASGTIPLAWADPSSMELARTGRNLIFRSPGDSGMRMATLGPA